MGHDHGSSFCFVHAADLHLDTPFTGIHEVAPDVGVALREASLDAFDALVELTLERRAAFLVVAGDVYDGAERGLRAQLRFRDGLARLSAAGIPAFVVHGNHDPIGQGWSAVGHWPELVTVFDTDAVTTVPVVRDGVVLATVQGISYGTRAVSENLALRFSRPDGAGVHVGLLHCNVAGSSGHQDYSPCSLDDLRRTQLDYFALGHVHQRAILSAGTAAGDTWAVYPGNLQARSPKPSEHGAKGAVVVEVRQGVVSNVEFVACDQIRFAEFSCEIDGLADLAELCDLLDEQGRELLAVAEGRSLVLRARLVGRGPIHGDVARPGALDDVVTTLRQHAPQRPFIWWDAVEDETRSSIDLDEIRGRGDFAADLCALADALADDAPRLVSLTESMVSSLPRPLAARLAELSTDPTRLGELLDHARTIALDAVITEAK